MIGSVWGEVSETRSRHTILSRKIYSKTHLRVRTQYQVNNWYFKLDLELFKYNNKFRKGYTLRADDHLEEHRISVIHIPQSTFSTN